VSAVLSSGGNVIITVQGVTGQTVILQLMTVVMIHPTRPWRDICWCASMPITLSNCGWYAAGAHIPALWADESSTSRH
jgi:hypothetical protein